MLSSRANVIIWEKIISSGANVIMVSSGANVIIWCYHVMLSSGMITHPFLFFLKTSLTLGELPEMHDVFKNLFKTVTKRIFSNLFLKHVTLGRILSVKFTPCHEAISSKV